MHNVLFGSWKHFSQFTHDPSKLLRPEELFNLIHLPIERPRKQMLKLINLIYFTALSIQFSFRFSIRVFIFFHFRGY